MTAQRPDAPFDSLPAPRPFRPPRWLEGLDVLLAVQKHPVPADAARALGISEADLLKELAQLEAVLRVQVAQRAEARFELMPAGLVLLPYAQQMVELRDRFLADLQQAAPARSALSIGASTTPGNYLLPALLRSFRTRFPDMKVTMQIADSAEIVDAVRAGTYEVGVTGSQVDDRELMCEPFVDDEIVVVAPPDHPLFSRPEVHVSELANYPWVVRETGSGTQASIEAMLTQQLLGRRIHIGLVLETTEAIKLAVRAGEGIALVSRRAVQNEVALGQLAATHLPGAGLTRKFYLVRSKDRLLSNGARELWSFLMAFARDQGLGPPAADARPAP